MSKLPGNAGVSLLGDKTLDFYRDPVIFCRQRIEKHSSRVFLCRLINKPTVFICSVEGMRELLCGEEACLLRLSLNHLFTGTCLESSSNYMSSVCDHCLKNLSISEQPQSVYSIFKRLGAELVLGLFLNVRAEDQPEVFQEIMELCTEHWHGLISVPVTVKVPLWTSGFAKALDARSKLMEIIKDKLENDTEGFVGALGSLPFPNAGSAAQHLLLLISALIPKALASLLTSFTLALGGPEQRESRQEAIRNPDHLHRVLLEVQRLWPPFIGGRRIAEKESTLADFCVPKDYGAVYVSYFIHRDPEVFQQPDSFLPERWSGRNAGQEHLLCSFGNGPRSCIGSTLTEIFIKEVCRYLLKKYDWCLDPPSQDFQYKWLPVSRPANLPSVSFTRLDQTVSE
ncbi:cytochrome P450 26A1-like isoform X2 [Poecilia reticulata]|uniref:Putative cytochrome P450 120 n=1 Tax=Poecilia reticulata TaxID=8081 RepID=A0A3P9NG49_POERE|nr:PREDICTED: cytochrome P450 26A1-like isoform X2 [Poecilia reticulata]